MRIKTFMRTATSAKGELALTLISALAAFAAGAALLLGAPAGKFSVAVTPASQTVTAGQTATFTVAVSRQSRFTSPVALSASGGPAGATKSFSPATVPGSSKSSTLKINTATGTTSTTTHNITITGTAGGATSTTTFRLTVVPASSANFGLTATPSQSVLSPGESTSHELAVSRSSFAEPIALSVRGLPNHVTAEFDSNPVAADSTTLTFVGDHNAKAGTYPITVSGSGFAPQEITRSTSLTLTIEERKAFQISGGAYEDLYPGTAAPLDLTLANPHNFALHVTNLQVVVDPETSKPGCSGVENYTASPLADIAPILLPAGATRTLSSLGVDDEDMPSIRMNDRVDADQDACKGAGVHLYYSGTATK